MVPWTPWYPWFLKGLSFEIIQSRFRLQNQIQSICQIVSANVQLFNAFWWAAAGIDYGTSSMYIFPSCQGRSGRSSEFKKTYDWWSTIRCCWGMLGILEWVYSLIIIIIFKTSWKTNEHHRFKPASSRPPEKKSAPQKLLSRWKADGTHGIAMSLQGMQGFSSHGIPNFGRTVIGARHHPHPIRGEFGRGHGVAMAT